MKAKNDVRLYRERDGKEEEAKRAYPLRDALAALLDLHDPMGAFGAVTIERKGSSLLAYVGPRQEEEEDELPKWAAEALEYLCRFPQKIVKIEEGDDGEGYELLFPDGSVYGKGMEYTAAEAQRWADRFNKDQYPSELRKVFESLLEEIPIPKKLDTPARKKSRWA